MIYLSLGLGLGFIIGFLSTTVFFLLRSSPLAEKVTIKSLFKQSLKSKTHNPRAVIIEEEQPKSYEELALEREEGLHLDPLP